MSKAGAKIIAGLQDAVEGNFAAVTIEGQRWVRAPEWQPIETAPLDNTAVLLFVVHPGDAYAAAGGSPEGWSYVEVGRFYKEHGWEHTHAGDPTHWMPLPEPPVRP